MLSCARRSAARAGAYRMLAAASFAALFGTLMLAPATLLAFGANPPLGYTGAPGQGTCASCHGTLTAGSGVTVNAPSSYVPGGPAISMTVTIPSTGGFELATLTQSGNAQAGALAAGPPPAGASFPQDAVSTVGTLQYVYSTVETTSWTFSWMPPTTSVGNVVLYVTGGNHGTNYSNSYTILPSAPDTLGMLPSVLNFTVTANGTAPAPQTFSVISSGAPLAFTTFASVVTPVGGSWLSALPPMAMTPMNVTVAVNPAGLAVGTYNGNVRINAPGAPNSPQDVAVILTVNSPAPPTPTLVLTPTSVTLDSPGTTSQTVQVKTSDGSAVTFTAAASTNSGGNWLSPLSMTGTTPATLTVAANLTGLTAGTYGGALTLTSSAVSNSPVPRPVTLVVSAATTGQAPPLCFRFDVVDDEAGGSNQLLLGGHGSVDDDGNVRGSGRFRIYNSSGSEHHTLQTGSWKAMSVVSFTVAGPADTQEARGGILVIQAEWTPMGGPTSMATLTIADTGTQSGVTVTIIGGPSFSPSGVQEVELVQAGHDESCRAECGRESEEERDRNRKRDDDEDGGHSRERR